MTPTNRIARHFRPTVPAPRYRPPDPPEPNPMHVAFWFVLGFLGGLFTAWWIGGGR